ncbi:MAG: cyclic nucleotide-binding domain-containing protein [Candidatus Scalindua sp.]|jgi:CRP-like cAMP-binding protein|nr:cyclic nucleotide-binding domain-containing protein [Candidatus Scalindua sp.]MBT5305505.1 cyclic nucleotide-binding domain-containing protein [Candidatus Scalindua sp.]MBT6045345.1 cyclic nucleotide-binding domain-containing protein [Candidatus Scalindua sp.]MBT6226715.1 cyclic nucleotide-binding domain-containing protein [Candidatus Scalindua sp.]MBT6564340.1 cyclic nucleotide-binding domain-containing protein [Candidatus Scalindua sp.]
MGIKGLLYTRKKILFKEGDIIFKENAEDCKEMYIIDSGRVNIVKKVEDTDISLTTLDEGDFFGEMSLITGSKRSASAIAHTKCKLHTMDKETFEFNLSNDINFMRQIFETLAHRLEATDTNLKRHIQRNARLSKVFNVTG